MLGAVGADDRVRVGGHLVRVVRVHARAERRAGLRAAHVHDRPEHRVDAEREQALRRRREPATPPRAPSSGPPGAAVGGRSGNELSSPPSWLANTHGGTWWCSRATVGRLVRERAELGRRPRSSRPASTTPPRSSRASRPKMSAEVSVPLKPERRTAARPCARAAGAARGRPRSSARGDPLSALGLGRRRHDLREERDVLLRSAAARRRNVGRGLAAVAVAGPDHHAGRHRDQRDRGQHG